MTSYTKHGSRMGSLVVLLAGVAFGAPTLGAQAPSTQKAVAAVETTVGMRVRIMELALPGSQLRARPVQDPQVAKLILQVLNVFPHGTGFRYNFEVTPLVAGRQDLRAHLERVDGSATDDLPEIPVLVKAELPADRLQPNVLRAEQPGYVGGYRRWQIVVGALWFAGLFAILFVRRKRHTDHQVKIDEGPGTLADRLRPLVEGARSGGLDDTRRAELERLLFAYWRQRRNLQNEKISTAITALRKDPEASPLFLKLEEWLHMPQPAGADTATDTDADITALLDPYRNAPALEDQPGTAEKESA